MVVAPKIAVIYSSTWGHLRTLAEAIAAGAKEAGAEVTLYQFPEIISDEALAKMYAAPKADYPIIKPDDLTLYDGFLLGIPTRYGRAVGAASAFFDHTGGLWAKGALFGKVGGIFTGSASQHGGQESTALTTIPFFAHHGIAFVPIGFANPHLTDNSEIIGGSAYGAASISNGDGSRAVSAKELEIATFQGTSFAKFAGALVTGRAAVAAAVVPDAEPEVVAAKALPPAIEEPKPYVIEETPKTEETAPTVPAPTATVKESIKKPSTAAPVKKEKSGGFFCCGKSSHYDE